jgi:hypothetical protein
MCHQKSLKNWSFRVNQCLWSTIQKSEKVSLRKKRFCTKNRVLDLKREIKNENRQKIIKDKTQKYQNGVQNLYEKIAVYVHKIR